MTKPAEMLRLAKTLYDKNYTVITFNINCWQKIQTCALCNETASSYYFATLSWQSCSECVLTGLSCG